MDWTEAIEIVVSRTGHEPYRRLTADGHPQHGMWRARMVEKATGIKASPAPTYPSLRAMAGNLASAVVTVAASAIHGGPIRVPDAVYRERLAICRGCEFHDPEQARCTRCGCTTLKLELAPMQCPLDPPRWGPFTGPPAAPG